MIQINPHDITPDYSAYGGAGSGNPARFGPFTVRLIHDDSPENPWEVWDCQTPLLSQRGRDAIDTHDSGDDIARFFGHVSDSWVSRHWRAICTAMDVDADAEDQDAREHARYHVQALGETRRERFAEYLSEAEGESRFFDMLAGLYTLAKIPALSTEVRGYSQGDWARVLLVATPAHADRCGYDFERPGFDVAESLKGDAELWRSYIFGDVYGYAVEDEHGETLDSCFGFFGSYYDGDPTRGGYVLAQAAEAVESELRARINAAVEDERAAREELRRVRSQLRAICDRFGPGRTDETPALDSIIRESLLRLAARWKAARDVRRQCAALLA